MTRFILVTDLLCEFSKVELIKGGEVFQVPSWDVRYFASFKIFQEHPNEVERKGLAHKKKNLMLSIFGQFDLMMWWEAKVRSYTTSYQFEEETDHSKTPQLLLVKLAQLNINSEKMFQVRQRKWKNDSN